LAEELLQLDPDSSVGWSILGHARLAREEFDQAVDALERYVELDPESANGYHVLGDAYRALGEHALAAAEYERALGVDPAFHYSTVALSVVEALAGLHRQAEERLAALVADGSTLPRFRIDAAFELAHLRRSEGRFREAETVLASLEELLRAEGVREAMALSVRGNSLMEAGELRRANELLERAVERSPGAVATRYLFARGLLELREGRLDDARRTAGEIAEGALPPDNPDRTEDKAAAYLRGMALLQEGKQDEAATGLSRAVALQGYEYVVYRLGLAQTHLANADPTRALAAASQVRDQLDPERGLDLELDRARALLVVARAQAALGRPADAARQARTFLDAWRQADPDLPDVAAARRLAGG
jgi:tetratricopeptide (TPR) repeat protein